MINKQNIQIICLPYAGGSFYCFQPFKDYWPADLTPITIAYPGRGERLLAPLAKDMESLVNDSWHQIKPILKPPYAILGHSLGSSLAYLLTHRIIEEGMTPPIHLFLSGTDSPSTPLKQPYRYLLSKADFKAKLKSYGGIADEVLNNEDAFNFFEPIIRADFQAIESWKYIPRPKLNIPATVITGTAEEMEEVDILRWQEEFNRPIKFFKLEGRHFFLFEQATDFVKIINNSLKKRES